MLALHSSNGEVEIFLSMLFATGLGNLKAYRENDSLVVSVQGARKLAYELLSAAEDAEFYNSAPSKKTMEWKDLPTNPIDVDIARMTTYLTKVIYPTSQIVSGETTAEEYVQSIAKFLVDEPNEEKQREELVDRRIDSENLQFFLQLGGLLKEKDGPLCKRPECANKEPHRPEDCDHVYDLTP